MMNGGKRKIELIEYVGLFLVAFSFLMLVVNPGGIGNLFNNMFNHAAPIIIKVYITGSIGIAIIISVTMGRLLERLGFTDALMRRFRTDCFERRQGFRLGRRFSGGVPAGAFDAAASAAHYLARHQSCLA